MTAAASAPRSNSAWGDGVVVARFEEIVAGFALVMVVLAVCWGVVTRYVTATPAVWTNDVAILGFAWVIFVGAAAAFKYGMHMSVDLLVNLFPKGPRRALATAVDVLVLGFLLYFIFLALQFCIRSWGDPMPILRWPRSFHYGSELVGGLCMLVRYGQLAWRRWSGQPQGLLEIAEPEVDALQS